MTGQSGVVFNEKANQSSWVLIYFFMYTSVKFSTKPGKPILLPSKHLLLVILKQTVLYAMNVVSV